MTDMTNQTANSTKLSDLVCFYQAPKTFGLRNFKVQKCLGWKPGANTQGLVPKLNTNYRFSRDFTTDLCLYLTCADNDGLYIYGPTGCGKTSGVLQAASRLNWPVVEVNCNATMEVSDLIGAFQLISDKAEDGTIRAPSMHFVYGPLAKAMKYGCILLLNEIDTLDPSQAVGLNSVIEGNPLTIVANGGEVIRPHPLFRIIATANSNGRGDDSGQYLGTGRQNLAFMDRFRATSVTYPEAAVEKDIITNAMNSLPGGATTLPDDIIDKMIRVAGDIRANFIGGKEAKEGYAQVESPISTRSLLRWATLTVRYHGIAKNALTTAYQKAIVERACERDQHVLRQVFKSVFAMEV